MKSVSHTREFDMDQAIADLFPLFSPEGEKAWVPGWDYENVMDTTTLSEDYVFLTRTHAHATTDAIWIVKRYEPESHLVQFYKVEPGDKLGVITVGCTALGNTSTRVKVTYKYIAIGAKGETFVSAFDEVLYQDLIDGWQAELTKHFESRP